MLKRCNRCHGQVITRQDVKGEYDCCVQCGWESGVRPGPEAAPHDRSACPRCIELYPRQSPDYWVLGQDRARRAQQMREQGVPLKQIARELNVSARTVVRYYHVDLNGFPHPAKQGASGSA